MSGERTCDGCGLEHNLWTTYVPGLGRQHDRAPLGFDGQVLANYGNTDVHRVFLSPHCDMRVLGWPMRWLCYWCGAELEQQNKRLKTMRERTTDAIAAEVQAGQQALF